MIDEITRNVTYAFLVWDFAEGIVWVYTSVVDQELCELLLSGLVELID